MDALSTKQVEVSPVELQGDDRLNTAQLSNKPPTHPKNMAIVSLEFSVQQNPKQPQMLELHKFFRVYYIENPALSIIATL